MNEQTIQQFLQRASEAYYAGAPIIDDDTYDALATSSGYSMVLGAREGDFKHIYRLYSLQKFYEGEDSVPPKYTSPVKTPKFDGSCISAYYIEGSLTHVVTRGDGYVGQDITNKFIGGACNPLPLAIPPNVGVLQLIIECVASKELPNSRNYAAGALNLKSLEEFSTRSLDYIVHGIKHSLTGTYTKDLKQLEEYGFKTVLTPGLVDLYPTDGNVVREDDVTAYNGWGFTSHHPKGAYALKVQKESVITTIKDVVWQVGKTGKVTPVALLEPVIIGEATVSRASLHNPAFIESLDLSIGDRVSIVRSGEIIPYITGKVE